MANTNFGVELTDSQFRRISELIYKLAGIDLQKSKKQLVKARLNSRLRELELTSFDQYLARLSSDRSGNELVMMLDSISTNLTSWFRERHHFNYLREEIIPQILSRKKNPRKVRIWSAGCSSGEEPYSIGITLLEAIGNLPNWDMRILATDLSTRVLRMASSGIYPEKRMSGMPETVCRRYFNLGLRHGEKIYQAKPDLKRMISFNRLNLMESWPMPGPFDVIFCRNVMIYFDKPTQNRLINRYHDLLSPGGILFLGHAESLAGTTSPFTYIEPAIYRRPK